MYTLKKRVLKISKRKMGTTGIKEMNRQSRKEKKKKLILKILKASLKS